MIGEFVDFGASAGLDGAQGSSEARSGTEGQFRGNTGQHTMGRSGQESTAGARLPQYEALAGMCRGGRVWRCALATSSKTRDFPNDKGVCRE